MGAASPLAVGHALAAVVAAPGGPTTVAASGAISTVTTSHVTTGANGAGVGLNTFSQFNVGSGSTVNLMVPANASALVNVVRDSKVEIDGIVNSYKAGKIGGDVYFVAPQGLVVGATGTVNVGSLNVATTTTAFADTLTAAGADLLSSLSASDIPLTSDGSIVVNGQVNAYNGVTLQAPTITVGSGAAVNAGQAALTAMTTLFAGTVNAGGIPDAAALTVGAGGVELVAEQSQTGGEGATTAATAIDISGALKGDYITLTSAATAQSDWTSSAGEISTTTAQGLLSGIAAAYVQATGAASIRLRSGADLEAAGAIVVGASTTTLADMPVIEAGAGKFALSAVVAQVDASATVSVESNATVKSTGGGAVSFTADNTATLAATSYNVAARSGSYTADTAAAATGTVTSSVDVAHGAIIGGGLINVQARNDDAISASATSFATKNAKAGIALAVADVSDSADAEFDADLGTAASKAGSLSVSAFSNTTKNALAATTSLGSGIAADAFSTASGEFDGVSGLLASKVADGLTSTFATIGEKVAAAQSTTDVGDTGGDSKSTPQLGSAVIVGLEHHSATANIGDPTTATKIYVTGAAISAAQTADGSIGDQAASEVATDSSSPNAPAISAVVSYFDDTHTTTATIAPATTLDAGSIAVNAQTQLPAAISTGAYDSASDIYNNLTSTTSRDAAIGDSDGLDLTGVVNLTLLTDTTKAWVGQGAHLTAEAGAAPATLTLAADWQISPASSMDVEAYNTLGTIEASGEFAFKDLLGKATDSSGKEIGGSYTESDHTSATVAGVDADAVIVTPGALTVQALNTDVSGTLAPDSGKGASIGVTGMVARTVIDDTTHAEVSDTAQVGTPSVTLNAEDTPHVVTVAAVVQSTGDEAFGAGIALNHIAADTAAFVGDASTDSPTRAPGAQTGYLHTDSLTISAHNGGFITALGVAGANVSGNGDQSTGSGTGTSSSAELPGDEESGSGEPTFQVQSGGLLSTAKAALGKVSDAVDGVTTKIANKIAGTSGAAASKGGGEGETHAPPAISLNLAGSVAYNQSNLTTRAELTGAHVDHYDTAPVATTLTAISDPVLVSGAGAGARLSTSGSTGTSASIAAALTLDDSTNRAEATISGGSLNDTGATAVHALNGGVRASAALGLAQTTEGSTALSGEGAGSASVLINNDSAGAYVQNATISGASPSASSLDVTAYNAAYMGAGGGSGFSGGEGGLGLSFTFLSTLDPSGNGATEAEITGSRLNSMGAVSDLADDASVLVGLSIDASTGSKTAGVNLSADDIDLQRTTTALVSGDTIDATGLTVSSDGLRQSALDAQLLAGAPSLSTLSGYDFSTGGLPSTVPTDPSGSHGLDIADGSGALVILAAGAGGAGENTAGAAVVAAQFDNSHAASVVGGTTSLGQGELSIQASDNALIVGAAVGAGAAEGQFAGVGSVAVLQSASPVSATLGGPSGSKTQVNAGAVDVRATDAGTLAGLTGAVSVSDGSAAFGASVTLVTAANTVSATAQNASARIQNGHFTTDAEQTGLFVDLAITGAVSEDFSIGGAATANVIDNGVQSLISSVDLSSASGSTVNADARDASSIYSGALGFAVGSTAAAGVAVTANDISAPTGSTSRVLAEITGGRIQALDVNVDAASSSVIETVAAGGAVGDSAGVAGSIVANADDGATRALITGGAQVTADDNVGVIASSQNTLFLTSGAVAFAGEGAGIGVSSGVNLDSGDTEAAVTGAGTSVSGNARSATDTLTVATGALVAQPDMSDISSATGYVLRDITLATQALTGVAINATSRERVGSMSLGIGAAGEGVAAAVNAVVDDLSGTTSAHVDAAKVGAGGAARQQVAITAADHAFDQALVASIAGSGPGAAGAAAVNVGALDRTTQAYETGAQVTGRAGVQIDAQSSQHEVGLVLGLAGSLVAGGGSTAVTTFAASTQAYASGGEVDGGTVSVIADDTVGANVNTGAAAGGAVGAAASFNVVTSANKTDAVIGSADDGATETVTRVRTDVLDVSAVRAADYEVHVVGGAVGGVGVAGMGAVLLSTDDTEAGVYDAAIQGESASAAVSSTVSAQETAKADLIAGALSVGGTAGLGAAVGVIDSSSTVGAMVADSNLNSASTSVAASSDKDYRAIMASAGGGAAVGGEAGVGVILLGTAGSAGGTSGHVDGSDVFSQAAPELSQIANVNNLDLGGDASSQSGGGVTSAQAAQVNSATEVSLPASTSVANSAILADVTHSILKGAVSVDATDTVATQQYVGALALGGSLGVGANLGYTNVADAVTARIDPTSTLSGGSVTVSAQALDGSGHAGEINSYVGAGGAVGLAAAASIVNLDDTVTASAGGTLDGGGGAALTVSAADDFSALNKTYNASIGGVAAGVVVSESLKSGQVLAETAPSGDPAVSGFASVSVQASGAGGLETDGLAAAGGIVGAGDGVYALADDSLGVKALLGRASYATAADGITVSATRAPDVNASALGVAVSSGAALGASVAQAYVEGDSDAHVADGAVIGNDRALSGTPTDFTVSATMTMPGTATADATAKAGVGGYFGGADATDADSHNTSTVQAYLGQDVGLPDGARLALVADRTSIEEATSSGVAAGGGLAVGANLASAEASGRIDAHVGSGLDNADGAESTVTLASLTIKAGSGTTGADQQSGEADSTRAYATSGSGAALAGAAAQATTNNTTTVNASLDDTTAQAQPVAVAGAASILADYTADTSATADSVQAALAGGSGSTTDRQINTTLTARIGGDQLLSADTILLSARTNNNDHDSGVTVGAGGAVNADAGSSTAEINTSTTASVGDKAELVVTDQAGDLRLEAVNFGQVNDTSTMITGGLVEVPIISDSLHATTTQTVTVGDSVLLFSPGTITVGAYGVETGAASVQASTYGALSYAEGDADTELHEVNAVRLGASDVVGAQGDISIMAGGSGDGVWTSMTTATANSQVYNYTVAPLDTRAAAHAKGFNTSSLDVGDNTVIQGWEDVGLQALDVNGQQNADAEGHNPYLQALSLDSRSGDAEHSSTSELTLGQTDSITAGLYAHQSLTVGADGTVAVSPLFNGTYSSARIDYYTYIQDEIAAAQRAVAGGLQGDALAVEQANIQAWRLSLQDTPDESATGGQAVVTVGGITAAAGDVTLRAASMTLNTASVTANGGVDVSLIGDDPAALLWVGDVTVPLSHATGGEVNLLGGPNASQFASNIHEVDPGVLPVITIAEHGVSATSGDHAVIVSGAVSNLGGTLNISNDQGDVDVYGQLTALQVNISAPEGNFILNDSAAIFEASALETAWADQEIITASTPFNAIINYGINALYEANYNPATDKGIQHGVLYDLNPGAATLFWNLPVPTNSKSSPDPSDGTYAQYDNKNADFWFKTAYFESIQKSEADSARTTPLGSVQADAVSINADWIDLGAKITAGRPTSWGFNVTAASNPVDQWDAQYASGQRDGSPRALTLAYPGDLGSSVRRNYTAVLRRGGLNTTGGADNELGASYDPVTKQVVVDPLDAAAQGAVYLTGHIVDTSASSLITVDAGLGQVNIQSTIARPLLLQSLNTGSSATAQVVVTDLGKTDAAGQPLTTWYEYDANKGLNVYDNNNNRSAGLDGAELIATPRATSTTSGAAGSVLTAYQPTSGLRYYWQNEYDFSRVFTSQSNFQSSVTNWNGSTTPTVTSLGFGNYKDGATGDFYTKVFASATYEAHGYKISAKGCYGLSNCTLSYDVATGLNVYEESSVAADHPATIAFTGQGTAAISVSTPGDLIIGGAVNNPLGTLTLSGPDASAGADVRLAPGGSLITGALTATNFSLGTASTPLSVTLTGAPGPVGVLPIGAVLGGVTSSAKGSDLVISAPEGSVNLQVAGEADLGDVLVGGAATDGGANFRLAASAGVYGYHFSPATGGFETHTLTAGAVTLDGGAGEVDVTVADAPGVSDAAAVLNAVAQGSITINKSAGDLYVGTVNSKQGDGFFPGVEITVPNGSILNALTSYTIDKAVEDNLAATWSRLHLTDSSTAGAQTVQPFETAVEADYKTYWHILNNAAVSTAGAVSLTPQQVQVFQGEANIALGGAALATADQVRAYVQGRLDTIKSFVTTNFGDGGPTGADGFAAQVQQITHLASVDPGTGRLTVEPSAQTAFDKAYSAAAAAQTGYDHPTEAQVVAYVQALYDAEKSHAGDFGPVNFYTYRPDWTFQLDPGSQLYRTLTTGAGRWTTTELTNAVSSTALVPVSDTQIISQAPNVTGRIVLLNAGGSVGSDLSSLRIPIVDGPLGEQQRAAIAAAAPGDVSIETDPTTGKPLTIVVLQRKVFGVDASQVLAVNAGANVYLQGDGAVALDVVKAPTAAKLYFAGGISASSFGSDGAAGTVDSGDVLLEAGSGSIGSAAAPVTLSTNVATLSSVRAQGDVHIEQLTAAGGSKDLVVGLGYAGGALDLKADAGSIVSVYGPSQDLHLQGGSIGLTASGELGTSAHPLQVETTGGDLTGAGGDLTVASPGGTLGVGDLTLSGQASIQARALRLDGVVTTGGALDAVAAGALSLGQNAQLRATGELSLTAASISGSSGASLAVRQGADGAAALTLTTTSGDLDLGLPMRPAVSISSDGALTLDSAGGLAVTAKLDARGDASLSAQGALQLGLGASAQSEQGTVDLKAASLEVDDNVTLQAAAGLDLTATGLAAFGDHDSLSSSSRTAALKADVGSLTAGDAFSATSAAAIDINLADTGALTLGRGAQLTAQGDLFVQAVQLQGKMFGAAADIGDGAQITSKTGGVLIDVGSLALGSSQRWNAAVEIDLQPLAGALQVGVQDDFTAPTFQAHTGAAATFGAADQIIAPSGLVIVAQGDLTLGAAPTAGGPLSSGAFLLRSGSVIAFGHTVEVDAPVSLTPSSAVEFDSFSANGLPNLYFGPSGSLNFGAANKGGSFTINNTPYTLVYTAAAFEGLNGATTGDYALATPLTLPGSQTSAPVAEFGAVFNGLGNAIRGLALTRASDDSGLFGKLDAGGVVQDVTLVAPVIRGAGYVGGVVGDNFGTVVNAYVLGGSVQGGGGVGGVIGTNEGGAAVDRATASAAVVGSADDVGGVAGASFGTISNAVFTGTASGRDDVGGLVGFNNAALSGKDGGKVAGRDYAGGLAGLNYATVAGSSTSAATVQGRDYVGGAVGWNTSYGTVRDVSVAGLVSGSGDYVGGLSGVNAGVVLDSSASTSGVSGRQKVGGLIGLNRGQVSGALSASGPVSGAGAVGGLVGWNDTGATLAATSGGALGSVTASGDNAGGYIGVNYGAVTGGLATGATAGVDYVGGFVGQNATGASVQTAMAVGHTSGTEHIGGFAGWNAVTSTLVGDTAEGDVLAGGDDVGGLAGTNFGTITSGQSGPQRVSGSTNVGGLVGLNLGQVSKSTSAALVRGNSVVGGLVGSNDTAGTIDDSFATGSVAGAGTTDDYAGGLVGVNYGVIRNAYATGAVHGVNVVGGLVGANQSSGSVADAYATGSVSSSGPAAGGL